MQVVIVCVILSMLAVSIKDVCAVTATQKAMIHSKLLATGIDCIKDHPLSLSDIRAFKNKMIPDKETPKCFIACLFKEIGIMDDMGQLSPELTKKNAQQIFKNNDESLKKAEDIVTICSTVNEEKTKDGTKGCDRAKLAFNCLTQNAAKHGFDLDF